ncbi:MAG: bifunctional 3,4-dihydroxy-2-butanone-4-phosphate synthase/GTP cyclohydrolase II [Candidatus Magasanikbacteria bacterium CG_4_10_14_0_2_um_filter_37_12]|uniref:Multifunctional fusion protein n=1 Tax=Candidatus Magasanikbacteria bacterium CG_4_10_14_0_2_um_filter_37_12 TaxID=1974637 RepID=A0A2M7V8B0_9BACT|nr:MAG: bifunctional 3,4-dihydroxy-2-butanone-4-phosphate synthase/GTP cyclohydrolase II [Candidatus Magasanikbacteria bacterium CG_4_10_14_0_2_um_filter_37_12]
MKTNFDSIKNAIDAIKRGEIVIIVDDKDRENERDLVVSAEHLTEEQMAFIIRHTGGVVCLFIKNKLADKLDLPPTVAKNISKLEAAFAVTVEAKEGATTGIFAKDRVATIKTAIVEDANPENLFRPGYVFPLRAQHGGVLWRAGHTEASVDLCILAGVKPVAVISELMNGDGTMMRLPELFRFAKEHNLVMVSVTDLIAYRHKNESFIELAAETELQTKTGVWEMKVYKDLLHDTLHTALIKGKVSGNTPVLIRVHSECLTGDVFGSLHCDCGQQLHKAMTDIEKEGKGVVLYMEQEGRGIGLINKIKAYKLQHKKGLDTVEANLALGLPEDLREYGIGAQIIRDLGVKKVRLMTNNPKKIGGITGYGIDVVEQVSIEISANGVDDQYLQTKKDKMGHLLNNLKFTNNYK